MNGKQLALLKARHTDKIWDAYIDGETGSVWIELRPGWTADPCDAHDIVASSVKQALQRFKDVQACSCKECTFTLAHTVGSRQ